MQRREFLAAASTAATLGLIGASPAAAAEPAPASSRQLYELRTYHFATADKLKAFSKFLAEVAVPALNRAGVEPVGVFALHAKDNAPLKLENDPTELYVLLPHKTFESFATLESRLFADAEFNKAGQPVLNAPLKDPAFTRFESQLLLAFPDFPELHVPSKAPTRVLQLRMYESHSTEKALKKVEMFNQGGELAIFKRVGMTGVFFGQGLAGEKMPHLTYMLGFDDEQALAKAWDAFRADPDWQKLSKDDAYKDTVSHITNLILRPEGASQI